MATTNTRIQDNATRTLRALRIIERRVTSHTLAEIGAEFRVSANTVADELKWARRQGLFTRFEEQILSELVPGAVDALKTALDSGNADVALEVLKGVGLLRKPTDRSPAGPQQVEDSLEVHVKRISSVPAPRLAAAGPAPHAVLGPAPLEAELVPHRDEGGAQDADGTVDLAEHLRQRRTEPPVDA